MTSSTPKGHSDEARQALLDAAHALSLLPPLLREQYVATLRLYADEPWRMGGRCKHCSEPIYQTDMGRWRHTNGMYTCTVGNKAEPYEYPPTGRD